MADEAKSHWSLMAKIGGGLFATVVAPLAVAIVSKWMDPPPPAAPAADPTPAAADKPAPATAVATASSSAAQPVPPHDPEIAPQEVDNATGPRTAHKHTANESVAESGNEAGSGGTGSSTGGGKKGHRRPLTKWFPAVPRVPLFDGKSLDGWKFSGPKHWSAAAGLLSGRLPGEGREVRDFLYTTTSYRNFLLILRFKCPAGDAGVLFRAKPDSVVGWQVLLGELNPGALALMSEDGSRPGDHKLRIVASNPDWEQLIDRQDWNELAISAQNDRLRCEINGHPTFDTDHPPGPGEGVIAFKLRQGAQLQLQQVVVARLAD